MIEKPVLNFEYDAIQGFSQEQIRVHYENHHLRYYQNLLSLIKDSPDEGLSLEELIVKHHNLVVQNPIYNNAAQVHLHSRFWTSIDPSQRDLSESFEKLLIKSFGSLEEVEKAFLRAGLNHFGSGYLVLGFKETHQRSNLRMEFRTFKNAEVPQLVDFIGLGVFDLWEHTYYLDFKYKKEEYLKAIYNSINWSNVEKAYLARL